MVVCEGQRSRSRPSLGSPCPGSLISPRCPRPTRDKLIVNSSYCFAIRAGPWTWVFITIGQHHPPMATTAASVLLTQHKYGGRCGGHSRDQYKFVCLNLVNINRRDTSPHRIIALSIVHESSIYIYCFISFLAPVFLA